MAEPKIISCREDGCKVKEDGVCLNGLIPNACPHAIFEGAIEEAKMIENDSNEELTINEEEDTVSIYSGNALTLSEASSISASNLSRLIIFAGQADAGKTTLLVTLFQLFQQSQDFSGFRFAGSKTLIGFEKRSHDSRIASERTAPETLRTIFPTTELLHIKVQNIEEPKNLCDLLFTDISGEYFSLLKNSTEECNKFEIGRRADHFVLFIDADLLSSSSQRQKIKADSIGILRSLTEANVLASTTFVQVVFSKWDLLKAKENQEAHLDFIEKVKSDIKNRLPELKNITFFEVASRPNSTSDLPLGFGLADIFPVWVKYSHLVSQTLGLSQDYRTSFKPNRQFSKFTYNINNDDNK